MEKKILKELAKVCRAMAKSSKDMSYRETKIVKKKCPCCKRIEYIEKKGKLKKVDYSNKFLKKAKIFEELARCEK